jgi:hypothetical protein
MMIFLSSRYPEYRALRAKSQQLALVWQFGHGIFWICVLSLPGAVAAWWVSRDDREPSHNGAWSVLGPVMLIAIIGILMKRYAVKKGAASGASSN